jgi:hypothetical protein
VLERRTVEAREQLLGAIEQARAMEILGSSYSAVTADRAQVGAIDEILCMRIARSTSPTADRLPKAKCSSTVCDRP